MSTALSITKLTMRQPTKVSSTKLSSRIVAIIIAQHTQTQLHLSTYAITSIDTAHTHTRTQPHTHSKTHTTERERERERERDYVYTSIRACEIAVWLPLWLPLSPALSRSL